MTLERFKSLTVTKPGSGGLEVGDTVIPLDFHFRKEGESGWTVEVVSKDGSSSVVTLTESEILKITG